MPLRGGFIEQGRARGRPLGERILHGAAQGGRGPARNLMCFCARKQLRHERVNCMRKKNQALDLRSRRVCSFLARRRRPVALSIAAAARPS